MIHSPWLQSIHATRHHEERTWLIGAADVAVLVIVYTAREAGDVLRIHQRAARQPSGAQAI